MRARPILAAVAAITLSATAAAPGTAAPADRAEPTVTVLAKGLVGPLSVAVAPDGTRYFSDNFAGLLYKQAPGGQPTVVFQGPKKSEVGAVSAVGGQLRFAVSQGDNAKGTVWTLDANGAAVQLGDTAKAEKKLNPDADITYGFRNTPRSCLAQLPENFPAQYSGVKETHPYATTTANGITYVADAGANALFAIDAAGAVQAIQLPPAIARMTAPAAEMLGLPACVVGKRFALESVPTDVEVGPDGKLYVTSLPGGPEDGSLGANGRVLRVNPATGKVRTVVRGLLSPTGLAVAANGDMYVAQLFPGVISRIKAGSSKVRPYLEVPLPGDVEVTAQGLVATIKVLPGKKPKGQVVQITS